MSVRRYTRKNKKVRGGATFHEAQDESLCGKHAINHILQENKFVWQRGVNELYISGDTASNTLDPKEKDVKINVYAACREFAVWFDEFNRNLGFENSLRYLKRDLNSPPVEEKDFTTSDGKPDPAEYERVKAIRESLQEYYKGLTDAEIEAKFRVEFNKDADDESRKTSSRNAVCTFEEGSQGNMVIQFFTRWASILGLKQYTTASFETDLYPDYMNNMIDILRAQIKKPEFLGVMLSVPGHYTAVVMYDDNCDKKRATEKVNKNKVYSYIDSMDWKANPDGTCKSRGNVKICYKEEDLYKKIRELEPAGMVFLYGYDNDAKGDLNPYKSVAYERMKAAMGAIAAPANATAIVPK